MRVVVIIAIVLAALVLPATASAGARERHLCERINAVRAQHGLRELRIDTHLNESASYWTNRMASKQRIYHGSWLLRLIRFEEGRTAAIYGEVVAVGQWTARAVLRAWMHSPTHRAVLLKRRITHLGLDARLGVYHGLPAYYWVVDVRGRFDPSGRL